MQVFNEGIVLLVAMMCPVFIDVNMTKDEFDMYGWIMTGIIGVCAASNIIVILALKIAALV